jgi:glycosyltransferase involved in cell wall biosynthesis
MVRPQWSAAVKVFQLMTCDAQTNLSQPQVCHVIASINAHTGGPALSVTRLAEALLNHEISSHLFTLDYENLGKKILPEGVKMHCYPATFFARNFRGFQVNASHGLSHLAERELDLIHNHGLWMFQNLYARQSAVENKLPLVISPRGMLESWSLKRSRMKKLLAWHLYEKKKLTNATLFHVTSTVEIQSLRSLGFKQPIALINNGVDFPNLDEQPSAAILNRLFPELENKRWLLFLSRVHPKKGLDNLLFAWQTLSLQFPDWHLLIAGPDLIGYQAKLESLTNKLGLQKRVSFTGMLEGIQKQSALANAELFVLPTHSENFGIAVAEALSYAVPVITTKKAPWQSLSTEKCGWWIEDDQQSLTLALAEAMQMSCSERKEMGQRGRALAENNFSWGQVAREMAAVYRWILAGGPPPDCVYFHNKDEHSP